MDERVRCSEDRIVENSGTSLAASPVDAMTSLYARRIGLVGSVLMASLTSFRILC